MSLLGIGVDLVDISRIRSILERRGEGFLNRVFTPAEQLYSMAQFDPASSLSVRFAAKEALIKALGVGWQPGMRWVEIEVARAPSGLPSLVLHGATKAVSLARGVRVIHLSLSHGQQQAIAFVTLES